MSDGAAEAELPAPEPLVPEPAAPLSWRRFLAWLPATAYTGLIWFLSSQTTLDFKLMDDVPMRDKGVHFVEYGVLGFLLAYACHASWPWTWRRFVLAWWLTCALGLVDELHQLYVPGRSADGRDLLADALGGALAIAVFAGLQRWRAARRR